MKHFSLLSLKKLFFWSMLIVFFLFTIPFSLAANLNGAVLGTYGDSLKLSTDSYTPNSNIWIGYGDSNNGKTMSKEYLYMNSGKFQFMNGNVGIGTIDPKTKLHLSVASSNKDVLLLQETTGNAGNSANIAFKTNGGFGDTDAIMGRIKVYDQGAYNGDMTFEVKNNSQNNNATSEMLRIKNNGNVGIGTNIPKEKLEVAGNIKSSGTICDKNGCIGTNVSLQKNANLSSTAGDNFQLKTEASTPNPNFSIGIGDGKGGYSYQPITWNQMLILNGSGKSWCPTCGVPVSANNRADMVVVGSGNVGIGTTDPQDKFDVAGWVRILTDKNPIRFTSNWTGFPDSANNKAEISNDTETYKSLMIVGNRSAGLGRRVSIFDRLEVNGISTVTDKLGVGTSTPTEKLDVVGNIKTKNRFFGAGLDIGRSNGYGFEDGASLYLGADYNNPNSWIGSNANYRLFSSRESVLVVSNKSGGNSWTLESTDATMNNRTAGIKANGGAYFASNVGIGTTNPTEKLEVAGNIKLTGSLVSNNGSNIIKVLPDGKICMGKCD